jgi:hypothetical protein
MYQKYDERQFQDKAGNALAEVRNFLMRKIRFDPMNTMSPE